jgi:putative effector of murein hydrolase LrgA (UPF0299 family)
MDIDTIVETEEPTLAQEMAKALAVSVVSTIGTAVTMVVVSYATGKFIEFKKNRDAKKTALTEEQ